MTRYVVRPGIKVIDSGGCCVPIVLSIDWDPHTRMVVGIEVSTDPRPHSTAES